MLLQVSPDLPVPLVIKEALVALDLKDSQDSLDSKDLLVILETPARLDLRVNQVTLLPLLITVIISRCNKITRKQKV